jgi:two-component system OmpR family sensor kinase
VAAGPGPDLWVSDTGPGVAVADRDRIFERFSRGSTARRTDGAGLGLSIVRAIAVAHGGQVLLDSVPGRGATFTVEIPAVEAS